MRGPNASSSGAGRGRSSAPGRWAWILLAAAPLGCIHEVDRDPEPNVALPDAYAELEGDASGGEGASGADRWWRDFDDEGLNRTVRGTLGDNLRLRQAWARIEQARAAVRKSRSGWFPQADAKAEGGRSRRVFFDLGPQGKVVSKSNSYELSGSASYEVDAWGKVRQGVRAAEMERSAARNQLESLAMSLTANVTRTWYDLAHQRALDELLQRQIETSETFLELVEARFRSGLTNALDVRRQRQQLANLRSQRPAVRSRIEVLRHRLALLQGSTPPWEGARPPAKLPEPPALPEVGVPAELVRQRPDVRAAQQRVVAADHRVGRAIAERFPSLRLQGSVGTTGASVGDLFKDFIGNIIGSIVAPLFQGGRLKAEVDRSRAVLEERVHAYGQTVIEAVGEVEDALAREQRERDQVKRLREELEEARRSLEEARSRYTEGLTDYLRVLDALRAVQGVEQRLLGARRERLAHRIALYRALGGSWTDDLSNPDPPDAEGSDGGRAASDEGAAPAAEAGADRREGGT